MISVLIVGTGSIGERHLRCFRSTGRCDVVACEPDENLRISIATKYRCGSASDLDSALSARRWDAAILSTPANLHVPMATQCAELGIDLLIEKPLATSTEGVERLALAARKTNIVRVAYVHRSIPAAVEARTLVRSGTIGEVKHVVGVAGANFPSLRPKYASTYFARRETGGGCIQDALTHMVHTVEWLVAPFERVYCDASRQVLIGVDVEDTVNLVGRLRGGVSASLSQNQFQAPYELTISMHGTLGSIRVELHRERVGVFLFAKNEWIWKKFPSEDRDAMFIRQANSFLDAREGKPDALASLEDGVQTLRVNLAALRSVELGREVRL